MTHRLSPETIERLDRSRRELLDLGLRNPLINHRRRAKQVPIVDERSAEIFRILVVDERSMTFDPVPEETIRRLNGEPSGDSPASPDWQVLLTQPDEDPFNGVPAARHVDTRLQTALESAKLQSRLLSIHRDARTHIEERGVNILYLALGFLHWYESASAPEPRRAPLILVPVRLERSGVRGRFRLSFTGEEIGANLSLSEKLKAEFRTDLPPLPEVENLEVRVYFDAVRQAVRSLDRWEVRADEITLGFFSFGKFLMYRDLQLENWIEPETGSPRIGTAKGLEIADAVLGDGFRPETIPSADDVDLDEIVDPSESFLVKDADSSQMLAVLDVMSGRNLVFQGPPGTGKSQTITNIIAEAVGRGKKVLFVAEKMAALDVVKRRLDEVGLGDAVLELHSHTTRKTGVLRELSRTLAQGKPVAPEARYEFRELIRLRNELNAYSTAVNEPVGASGTSFIAALGHVLRNPLNDGMEPFDFEPMRHWSGTEYRDARRRVEILERHLEEAGPPSENPFHGSGLEEFLPSRKPLFERHLAEAADAVADLLSVADRLAGALSLSVPRTLAGIRTLHRAAVQAADAPLLDGIDLGSPGWAERAAETARVVEAGRRLTKLRRQYEDRLLEPAWDEDLFETRRVLAEAGHRWWRFLSADFRRARVRLRGLCREHAPKDSDEAVRMIDDILESQRLRQLLREAGPRVSALFGNRWRGENSNWNELQTVIRWMADLHRRLKAGELPEGLIAALRRDRDRDSLRALAVDLERKLESHAETARRVAEDLRLPGETSEACTDQPLETRRDRFILLKNQLERLGHWARYLRIVEELRDAGLDFVLQAVLEWSHPRGELLRLFDHSWFSGLVETAYTERPSLRNFDLREHEESVQAFSRLDRAVFEYNRARLIVRHWNDLPRLEDVGELRVLKREINKKRRIMPIRRLLTEAGRAVQAIKPVFMMSPMSIAAYTPPGSVHFDLVVFDEASQVRPVDAFGAIIRGDQTVVVGDSRQLPPTGFFDTLVGPDDGDDRENVGDLESILSLFLAKGAPERMLRWHYRSRHDSLIAVSNREFYDNRLLVFPSPGNNPVARGLRLHHLPDTVYHRGASRTNPLEAREVARAVMEHARNHPDLTLGVVAFSTAQRDAVELQLELLRREDPDSEPFFAEDRAEPFFVKNLENVQGDERDVIFISIGYGRTSEGYLAMHFGPLNRDGGERRLNVLITRARLAMDVFSNFTADDLDLERAGARGVAALKTFLKFAETGVLEHSQATGPMTESPFEKAVIEALRARGVGVASRVGTAGLFIDIGVSDPDHPGRYLLGIECDGAASHAIRFARDRDRLRQEVLEALGWRIHRIWSTAWYQDPDRELERTLAAIEDAGRGGSGPSPPSGCDAPRSTTVTSIRRELPIGCVSQTGSGQATRYRRSRRRIERHGVELHEMLPEDLLVHVLEVLDIEAPIHRDELARRIAEAAGLRRTGSRIRAAVERAVAVGANRHRLRLRGEFVWSDRRPAVTVRDRSNLDPASRKIDLVPPEEIDEALMGIVRRGFSLEPGEAVTATARALGFHRVTGRTAAVVRARLDDLLARGLLKRTVEGRVVSTAREELRVSA